MKFALKTTPHLLFLKSLCTIIKLFVDVTIVCSISDNLCILQLVCFTVAEKIKSVFFYKDPEPALSREALNIGLHILGTLHY